MQQKNLSLSTKRKILIDGSKNLLPKVSFPHKERLTKNWEKRTRVYYYGQGNPGCGVKMKSVVSVDLLRLTWATSGTHV